MCCVWWYMTGVKAYCCANCMEFWAELSVAYHWTQDTTTEYNKWFPFNRHQLLSHDVVSHGVLHKYWNSVCEGTKREVKFVDGIILSAESASDVTVTEVVSVESVSVRVSEDQKVDEEEVTKSIVKDIVKR